VGFNVAFLRVGLAMAFFRDLGTDFSEMDALIRFVSNGVMMLRCFFRSHVGHGSSSHDLVDACITNRSTVDSVTVESAGREHVATLS
jgi:hypothetical protein